MDATCARLREIARSHHMSGVAVNDCLGVECYYSSAGYFKRKAAEFIDSARILADCRRHRGRQPGDVVAANLTKAAQWRRRAMEAKYGPA